MGRFRLAEPASDLIAWLGLVLMALSFLALMWTREPLLPHTAPPHQKKPEPFSLVILDPGHGGQDSGAMAGSVLEKDLTLDVVQRVDRLLGPQGISTLLTRTGDSYVSLSERAQLINRANNAIVVSIHFDEGLRPDVSGIETYFAAQQSTGIPTIASWLPFLQKIANIQPNVEIQILAKSVQQDSLTNT